MQIAFRCGGLLAVSIRNKKENGYSHSIQDDRDRRYEEKKDAFFPPYRTDKIKKEEPDGEKSDQRSHTVAGRSHHICRARQMNDESLSHIGDVDEIDHVQRECCGHCLQGERDRVDNPVRHGAHEDEKEEREGYLPGELPTEQIKAASCDVQHHGKARDEIDVTQHTQDMDEQGCNDDNQPDGRARPWDPGELIPHDVDQVC